MSTTNLSRFNAAAYSQRDQNLPRLLHKTLNSTWSNTFLYLSYLFLDTAYNSLGNLRNFKNSPIFLHFRSAWFIGRDSREKVQKLSRSGYGRRKQRIDSSPIEILPVHVLCRIWMAHPWISDAIKTNPLELNHVFPFPIFFLPVCTYKYSPVVSIIYEGSRVLINNEKVLLNINRYNYGCLTY